MDSVSVTVDTENCFLIVDIDGFVQDCINSSVLAMELLQSCTKPSMYGSQNNAPLGVKFQDSAPIRICLTYL